MKLTARQISTAKPTEKPYKLSDGGGLYLLVNLVFAAQIRTKAPCRLQLMDGGDRLSWIFEQLPDVCTSAVQEVAYV